MRARPPKTKKITMSEAEFRKKLKGASMMTLEKTLIIFALALKDEIDADDDLICKVAERANRYSEHIEKNLVRLNDVEEILRKKTNITFGRERRHYE